VSVPKSPTALKALLAARGLRPSRFRGQNFLADGNLVQAIAREAAVGPDECVLEVGTGLGILTEALAETAGCVVTVDIDGRLQEVARTLREWGDRVLFLEADILAGKRRLNPEVMARFADEARKRGLLRLRMVSNLPYAVATPVLANLLWGGHDLGSMVVLVQREAAERFTAPVGSAEYGPMAVAVGLFAEAKILRRVPPAVFWPAPSVESVLLRLRLRDPARARALAEAGLPDLLQGAFLHRRKTIRHGLPAALLAKAGIDPSLRPQQVEPEQWAALA